MAQTLKFGKGTWATKTGSSMAYNDQNGNYKPLPFNVERDSIATRVNKQGLIEVVGHDKLRIDYTDSAKGVALLEKSATNLITYSEDFSSLDIRNNAVVTSDAILSPSGLLNADEITFDGTSLGRVQEAITVTDNQSYTISLYLKNKNLSDTTQVWIGFSQASQGNYVTITDEWQRYDITTTSDNTTEYPRIQFDGTGSLYAWGFQVEVGNLSSYIPTSGSTVQRQADVVNGSGNSEVLNDSEGVLFADYKPTFAEGSRQITLNDNTYDNRIILECRENGTKLRAQISDGGANQMEINFVIPSIDLYYKCAIKYKANDGAFWINGFKIDVDTNMSVPSGMNNISFSGRNDTSLKMTGKTKELGYYDATLTDAELETLTSYRSLNELVTELNLNTL